MHEFCLTGSCSLKPRNDQQSREGELGDPVTRTVIDAAVEQALRRLLDGRAFVLVYEGARDGTRLALLRVYAGGAPGTAPARFGPEVRIVEDPSRENMERWVRERIASDDPGTRIVAVRRLPRLKAAAALRLAERVLRTDAEAVVRGQTAAALGHVDSDDTPAVLDLALADNASASHAHRLPSRSATRQSMLPSAVRRPPSAFTAPPTWTGRVSRAISSPRTHATASWWCARRHQSP